MYGIEDICPECLGITKSKPAEFFRNFKQRLSISQNNREIVNGYELIKEEGDV